MGMRGMRANSIVIDELLGPMELKMVRNKIPGLFKEEDAVFKAARRLFRQGPNRVLIDMQGFVVPYSRIKNSKEKPILEVLANYLVYVRDDGWTLATPRKWVDTAEDMWRTNWIGRIHLSAAGLAKHSFVEVYTESGVCYCAGDVDEEGLTTSLSESLKMRYEAAQEDQEGHEAHLGPKSLDDIRAWLRKGCPD